MKEALTAAGWIFESECSTCKGKVQFYKHKDHGDYRVQIKIRSNTFSFLNANRVIAGPYWGYQMADKLKAQTWV